MSQNSVVDQPEFAGRHVVVTGGTRGIGLAVVNRFAAAGARVLTTSRSAPGDLPAGTMHVPADLGTADGVDTLAARVHDELGTVDVVVHNAGLAPLYPAGPLGIPDRAWQESLDVNFLATVRLDRALLPAMIEAGSGAVVVISTGAARTPNQPLVPYGAAKAALSNYAKAMATALGPTGVRMNTVFPGLIDTPAIEEMVDQLVAATDTPRDGAHAALAGDLPLGRLGQPAEVAELVAFLASYITGATVSVDGGKMPAV